MLAKSTFINSKSIRAMATEVDLRRSCSIQSPIPNSTQSPIQSSSSEEFEMKWLETSSQCILATCEASQWTQVCQFRAEYPTQFHTTCISLLSQCIDLDHEEFVHEWLTASSSEGKDSLDAAARRRSNSFHHSTATSQSFHHSNKGGKTNPKSKRRLQLGSLLGRPSSWRTVLQHRNSKSARTHNREDDDAPSHPSNRPILHLLLDHLTNNLDALPPLIFRCNGNLERQGVLVHSLQESISNGSSYDLQDASFHDVANIMKLFLKRQPLLNSKVEHLLKQVFLMAPHFSNLNEPAVMALRRAKQIRCFRVCLLLVPRRERELLFQFLHLFREIAARPGLKMSLHSLAVCFAPVLFPQCTSLAITELHRHLVHHPHPHGLSTANNLQVPSFTALKASREAAMECREESGLMNELEMGHSLLQCLCLLGPEALDQIPIVLHQHVVSQMQHSCLSISSTTELLSLSTSSSSSKSSYVADQSPPSQTKPQNHLTNAAIRDLIRSLDSFPESHPQKSRFYVSLEQQGASLEDEKIVFHVPLAPSLGSDRSSDQSQKAEAYSTGQSETAPATKSMKSTVMPQYFRQSKRWKGKMTISGFQDESGKESRCRLTAYCVATSSDVTAL